MLSSEVPKTVPKTNIKTNSWTNGRDDQGTHRIQSSNRIQLKCANSQNSSSSPHSCCCCCCCTNHFPLGILIKSSHPTTNNVVVKREPLLNNAVECTHQKLLAEDATVSHHIPEEEEEVNGMADKFSPKLHVLFERLHLPPTVSIRGLILCPLLVSPTPQTPHFIVSCVGRRASTLLSGDSYQLSHCRFIWTRRFNCAAL